jgi:Raf kinase inhibitor-like YbhB/YbcL family protein
VAIFRLLTLLCVLALSMPEAAVAQTTAGVDGPLTLSTPAFVPGGPISWRYTCYNIVEPSPPLDWSGVPNDSVSLALVFDAPERPGGMLTQWLVFNLPADITQLPEGIPKLARLENGGLQGRNDFGGLGFAAPCPPVLTTASYRLSLYALDSSLELAPGATESEFMQAVAGHILDQVQISGSYLRPAWPWG